MKHEKSQYATSIETNVQKTLNEINTTWLVLADIQAVVCLYHVLMGHKLNLEMCSIKAKCTYPPIQ